MVPGVLGGNMQRERRVLNMLASLLEFPNGQTFALVRESMRLLDTVNPKAKMHLKGLGDFCQVHSLDQLERTYSTTFDSEAVCCPFVANHLLSHDRSRNMFLGRLREQVVSGASPGGERVDHIAVMLRSLLMQESIEEARELIAFCLIPALSKMISVFPMQRNPYEGVLRAVLLMLYALEERSCKAA
jgi:nitrate reductase assembly molybdenum cofactor insertion protein NarJ